MVANEVTLVFSISGVISMAIVFIPEGIVESSLKSYTVHPPA
jgi:hypothetical protein